MEDTADSQKSNGAKPGRTLKEKLDDFFPYLLLGAVLAGFAGGIASYRGLLEITNQETLIKGCCIPKDQLAGTILKHEAVREIESLIDIGQTLDNDQAKTRVWLMQVLAFVHGIGLEKDSEWQGQKMPAIESDLRYVLTDPSIDVQRQKTLGILKGFRAALQTRVAK
jgi:hypothetical protein